MRQGAVGAAGGHEGERGGQDAEGGVGGGGGQGGEGGAGGEKAMNKDSLPWAPGGRAMAAPAATAASERCPGLLLLLSPRRRADLRERHRRRDRVGVDL